MGCCHCFFRTVLAKPSTAIHTLPHLSSSRRNRPEERIRRGNDDEPRGSDTAMAFRIPTDRFNHSWNDGNGAASALVVKGEKPRPSAARAPFMCMGAFRNLKLQKFPARHHGVLRAVLGRYLRPFLLLFSFDSFIRLINKMEQRFQAALPRFIGHPPPVFFDCGPLPCQHSW
jgi:hypothetical protein